MNDANTSIIQIYTDGSCDTRHCIGAWIAIIFWSDKKEILSGIETNTTHNKMELLAVVKAIERVNEKYSNIRVRVFSDSQYVIQLPARKEKLESANFLSKKETPIQNHELVKLFFEKLACNNVSFEKIAAHQKKSDIVNYNIEADLLVRKMVREQVRNLQSL